MTQQIIRIEESDPREPEIQALITALDSYMLDLYPAESTHRIDLEVLASKKARFYSATLNTELCGCAAILLDDPDYAEVKRLYVSPRSRGQGIAQAILQRLEQCAFSLGIDTLRLETGIHQPEALALFTAFGFNRCERFGNYPANDPNSVFMEKCILA